MTETTVKTYEIGGKIYEQRELSFGQLKQLAVVLEGITPPEEPNIKQFIMAIGDQLDHALAVVLTEKGTHPADKDLSALAKDLAFSISPTQVLDVVEDFFTINPVADLLKRLTGLVPGLVALHPAAIRPKSLSSSSQEET